jgi:two-component system cell cycle sensor histidine kinase/response regulator CckA
MSLFDRILPPKLRKTDEDSFSLEEWRIYLSGVLAWILVLLLPLLYLVSFPYLTEQQHYGVVVVFSALWTLMLLRSVFPSNRIFHSGFLWVFVITFMIIFLFVNLGPSYARASWLILTPVLAALYFGTWGGILMACFNAAMLLVLWLVMDPGNPAWAETYRLGLANWSVFVLASTLLAICASLPAGFLLVRLDSTLQRAKEANEELSRERSQLERTHHDLEMEMRERALSQMALKDSEERLARLADNLPNAVVFQVYMEPDGEWHFTYVSKSVERLNEVSVEAVLDNPDAMKSQVAPEFMEDMLASQEQALESLSNFHYTVKCILPSGKQRWFDLASTPRRMPGGGVLWDGIQVDVTDREEARIALRDSKQQLSLLTDNLPDAMVYQAVIEPDGSRRFTYVSKSVERLNEVTVEAVLADPSVLYQQVAPEFVDDLKAKEDQALKDRTTFRYTLKSILPSGRERWFDLASTPQVAPDGSIVWDGVQIDVTDREKARIALRESERLYRALVETSHDGIVIIDDSFKFISANEEFCQMMGYTQDEIIGMDFRETLAEETAHIPLERYEARMRGESPPRRYEFMIKSRDGAKHWVEINTSDIVEYLGQKVIVSQLLDITERKKAENALKESESQYRALVEYSHAGIMLINDSRRIIFANGELCAMTGYARDELQGSDFRMLLAEETAHIPTERYETRLRGEETLTRYEYMMKRKDGSKFWVETSVAMFANAMGETYVLSQLLDISERKEAEKALTESESLYRALVDDSHSGIILLDDLFRFTYANDQFCTMMGYRREEIVGEDFKRFLAKETAHIPINNYLEKLEGGDPDPRYEFMVKRKDGVKRWVEVSSSEIKDAQGHTLFMGQLLDITERKEAEKALKKSEQLHRALVEHSHAGILQTDGNFHLTYFNEEFCKLIGYEPEELMGRDFREMLAEETMGLVVENYLARQRGENPPSRYEIMVVRKDGIKRWVEVSAANIVDSDGQKRAVAQLLDITERKESEEALKESESLFRAVVDNAHDGLSILGDSFNHIYVNDEFCRITGYSRDELMSFDFRQTLAEETAHVPTQHYLARQRGENPPSCYEFMIQRKDGAKRWVETNSAVITDASGNARTVAQLLDITERKKAEEALKASEQRFRAIFNMTYQFTGLLDTQGRLILANKTSLDAVGKTNEELKGLLFWETPWWRNLPAEQKRLKESVKRAASGEFLRYEAEHTAMDGAKLVMDFSIKPIYGQDGEVIMLLPEGRDISDRIRAEQALKESEKKFRHVVTATPIGIQMYEMSSDNSLVLRGANPAANRILKLDHDRLIGLNIEDAFPGMAESETAKNFRKVAVDGNPWFNEVIEYSDDRISGAYDVYAFRTAPGELNVMFQDITERKKAEEEKARLETQLRQSQKMEAIGTLTGGIAHDFNNILGAILGTSEASLLKGNDFEALTQNMGSIRDMSIRGRELVHRLLAFSRQDEQATRSMDLAGLVSESLNLIKAMTPAKVKINSQLSPGLMVTADSTQIQQMILNLCTNAVQAMEDGGGELSILVEPKELSQDEAKLRPGLNPGSYVLLKVSDTGHGISEDVLDRIFDPFFTTKPMGRGTGLGLSLAHGIVRAHQGAITADSQEGAGTTISVLLPLASETRADRSQDASESPMDGRGEHILVVDDEEIIVHSTAQTLEALGYKVSAYTTPLEAAAALEKDSGQYDLILTDHIMPGLTGRQLAEKAGELKPGLPVILMTGMPDGMEEGGGNGQVARVLTKPVTIREVGQAVRQVLDQQGQS